MNAVMNGLERKKIRQLSPSRFFFFFFFCFVSWGSAVSSFTAPGEILLVSPVLFVWRHTLELIRRHLVVRLL